MPDVQTQVIDQSQLSADSINLSSRVAGFKQALTDIRSQRVDVVTQMEGLNAKVESLVDARNDILNYFQQDALNMYPDIVGMDLASLLDQLAADHPLVQLWQDYQVKLADNQKALDSYASDFSVLAQKEATLEKSEQDTFNMYAVFAENFPGQVPTTDEVMADLQAVDVIPKVEQTNVVVTLPAIERLDPMAAAMVTAQTVVQQTGYDQHMVNKTLRDSMAPPPEDDTVAQAVATSAAQSASLASDAGIVPSSAPGLNMWGIGIAVLAFFYIFGGSSSEKS